MIMKIKAAMDLSNEQVDKVKAAVEKEHGTLDDVESIEIFPEEDGSISVRYKVSGEPKIERIRRITGYLVGTTDRWNDAKKAELSERVHHA